MAARAGLPLDGNVVGSMAPVANANGTHPMVAPPAGPIIPDGAARLAAPAMARPVGANIANLAAPVVVPMAAPPGGPNMIANLGGWIAPPDVEFDIPAGLLGSPLRKSNIGSEIHAWIDE